MTRWTVGSDDFPPIGANFPCVLDPADTIEHEEITEAQAWEALDAGQEVESTEITEQENWGRVVRDPGGYLMWDSSHGRLFMHSNRRYRRVLRWRDATDVEAAEVLRNGGRARAVGDRAEWVDIELDGITIRQISPKPERYLLHDVGRRFQVLK